MPHQRMSVWKMRMVAEQEGTWKIFVYLSCWYLYIHRSRISPSVQEEKEERYLFWYFLNTSVRMYQAWVVMFQKCPEKKKTPSLRPTQAPWPFAWKYSKYFWKKRQSHVNIRSSTCPRSSWVHSPSSMLSTKSWPSYQIKFRIKQRFTTRPSKLCMTQ